jgi:hypothetical protein
MNIPVANIKNQLEENKKRVQKLRNPNPSFLESLDPHPDSKAQNAAAAASFLLIRKK